MQLINLSPFSADRLVVGDPDGAETLLVVVKATYEQTDDGLEISEEQVPVGLADEYTGEAGESSLSHTAEGALFKPACDVVMTGHAYAGRHKEPQVDVSLRVGRLRKTVRVFGDRHWGKSFGVLRIEPPEPFSRIPLVYERAFGGRDDTGPGEPEAAPQNSVGVGFRAAKSQLPKAGASLPNLETPTEPIRKISDRPGTAGFGFVCPNWDPRLQYAGTYDDAWLNARAPLLPSDFDPRFFQVAPADQIIEGYLRGGEPVEIKNATRSGKWRFTVPRVAVTSRVMVEGTTTAPEMLLDTLVIDGDQRRVQCLWRGHLPVHDRVYDVDWIKITAEVHA